MRKPFFKRKFVRVLLVLLGLLCIGAFLFYQAIFYVPTLPPVEPLPAAAVGGGGTTLDLTAPIKKVQEQVRQLNEVAKLNIKRDYELSVSEADINRLVQGVMASGNFPGHQLAQQMQVRFTGGEVNVIAISPVAALASRWHAVYEYLPGGLASSERLIAVTTRIKPVQVGENELTLEPESVLIGKVKLPAYVITNLIEKVGAKVGIPPQDRSVQVPGKIREVLVEDGWFKVIGTTEQPVADPQAQVKSGNEKIEKLLNRVLEMLTQQGTVIQR